MRLHLACGETYLPGWVNCDIRDDVQLDVRCDLLAPLPFPNASADHVRADDFLEHIPPCRLDGVLADWWRVCSPGATVEVRVPNVAAIARSLVDSPGNHRWHELLIRNLYGGHRWGPDGAWDAHHSGWTPALLGDLLGSYGFKVLRNDESLNMRVEAVRVERSF